MLQQTNTNESSRTTSMNNSQRGQILYNKNTRKWEHNPRPAIGQLNKINKKSMKILQQRINTMKLNTIEAVWMRVTKGEKKTPEKLSEERDHANPGKSGKRLIVLIRRGGGLGIHKIR